MVGFAGLLGVCHKLRNMLNYARREQCKALAESPSDFEEQLRSMGYL